MKTISITEEFVYEITDVLENLIAPDSEMESRRRDMIKAFKFLIAEENPPRPPRRTGELT